MGLKVGGLADFREGCNVVGLVVTGAAVEGTLGDNTGLADGAAADGLEDAVCLVEGDSVETVVGEAVGLTVGFDVFVGTMEGDGDGATVGRVLGVEVGLRDALGMIEGAFFGTTVGDAVGEGVGRDDGVG